MQDYALFQASAVAQTVDIPAYNTVKPIFGHQEGAELGYNPQKPGRPSHNFHSYFIGSVRISRREVIASSGERTNHLCGVAFAEALSGRAGRDRPLIR